MMRQGTLLFAVVLLVGGCKWFGSGLPKDNVAPPAELTAIAQARPVQRLWSADIGKGERKLGLHQAPTVADGRAYAAEPGGRLAAFDAGTGRTLWERKDELRWSGGPGAGEGTLVVGTLDGEVVAFNPDSGDERWRARVSSEVISRPAIGRGIAVVRCNDGRIFGYSITDGSRRWVYDRGLPSLTLRGNAPPVIDSGSVFLGYDSGEVVALRLEDGALQWEQMIARGEGRTELDRMVDIDGEMVASGSELYVAAYNSRVVALDAGSGRPLWNRDMSVYAGLTLAGDRLLVADAAGTVWALDRRSGASLWRQDALAHRWLTTPALQGGYAVVGDFEGYLHWLALDSGALVARQRLARKPIRGTPQSHADAVVAAATDGSLGAYRVGAP